MWLRVICRRYRTIVLWFYPVGIWWLKIVIRLSDMINKYSSKLLDSIQGFKGESNILFSGKTQKKHQSFSLLKLTPVGVKIFSNSLKPRVLKFQYMGKLTSGSLFQRFLVPCPGDSNPEGQGWSRVVARQIGTTGPRTRPGKPCLRGQGQSCLPTEDHGQRGGASDFSFDFWPF